MAAPKGIPLWKVLGKSHRPQSPNTVIPCQRGFVRKALPRWQSSAFRCAATLPLAVIPAEAALADPQALSTFVPVQTQDALVTPTGVLEFQGTGVYTRDDFARGGRDLLNLTPTVKLGAAKGVQIDVSAPYAVGNQSTASQGAGGFDIIYNFLPPAPNHPALAIQPGYQVAYGPGHTTDQYFLRGLATQWLGSNDRSPRLHLNVNWTHYTTPSPTSRQDAVEIGVAYSMLIKNDTALVLDAVHGAKSAKNQDETIFDAGLRWEVNDHWALSGGIGAGVGQESPAFRVIFAIQRDFHLF